MIREQVSIRLAYKVILHDRRIYSKQTPLRGSKVQHFWNAACLCQAKPRQKNGALLALFLCRIRIPMLRCLLEIFVGSEPYEFVRLQIFRTSKSCRLASSVGIDLHFIHKFF